MSYTIPQRVLIIESYYESKCSVTETLKKLHDSFENNPLTERIILRIVNNFEERGTVADVPGSSISLTYDEVDVKEEFIKEDEVKIEHSEESPVKNRKEQKEVTDTATNDNFAEKDSDSSPEDSSEEDKSPAE